MFESNGSTAVKVIYSRGENKRIIELLLSFLLLDYLVIRYINYYNKKACPIPIQVFFNPTYPFQLSPAANVQHFALFSTPGVKAGDCEIKYATFEREKGFSPFLGPPSQNITLEEARILDESTVSTHWTANEWLWRHLLA